MYSNHTHTHTHTGVLLLLLFAATASDLVSSAPLNHTTNNTETITEELFEGDIVISEEMIRQYYNITDFEHKTGKTFHFHTREKRGATSVSRLLWPKGVVYYTFDTNLPMDIAKTVRTAMNRYEKKTCLRFVKKSSGNYIKIKAQAKKGCRSYIGMRGGEQALNLKYPGCNSVGIAEHEIGHAIGFWHEQSRPDRDSYVTIVSKNIKPGKQGNFMKRRANEVNSLGVGYDYGSIMHYSTRGFSTGGPTIQVNNQNEYRRQGSPRLGQRKGLSARDIQQVNYLYKCRGFGITGRLRIKVRNGVKLPDTDPWLNSPDPYVKITAVHTSTVTRQTSVKSGTQNPKWNELIDFGFRQWKYFRVRIWDRDVNDDDPMSISETYALTAIGSRKNVKHCTNPSCSGYLWLDYYLCPNGWSGNNCAHRWANLRFFVRYGRGLPDKDGWLNKSDPYVEIIAYSSEGTSIRRITSKKQGDQSPDWNQNLYFGTGTWKRFKIRVWDSDLNADDPLSRQRTLTIRPGSHVRIRYNCYSGYIIYDYYFQ